ncbi:hypothetical protein GGR51DRAFT_243029 [Nemania sp. FL0031]|nr:hypothetical protein GGR51DRAFT_243029 [Nemania sp. FL0031]
MQVIGDQNEHDKHHAIYPLIAHGAVNGPFQDVVVLEHTLWGSSGPGWRLDGFPIDQQAADHVGYLREQQEQSLAGTSRIDYYPTTNSHLPAEDWSSGLALDIASNKYRNSASPFITTPYPSTPQNFIVPLEPSEPTEEIERSNESASPTPTSPEEGPKALTKRNRNRLAAAKCRKKAKQGVDELQQRERDLLRENKMLNAEASILREEVLQLKCEILRHSACDNHYIRQYIQSAAEQVGRVQSEKSACGIPAVLSSN